MVRTDAQLVARINAWEDWLGFGKSDLIVCLPYALARPFLSDDATEAGWTPEPRDQASVLQRLKDYMPFAWDKANACRGLSASRSIAHMQAWLWLLGEDAFAEAIEDYSHYGKPQLRAICERYGIDWSALDDGLWKNSEGDHGVAANQVPRVLVSQVA